MVVKLKQMNMKLTSFPWPRCIYLAGVDGTGKTTQARAILAMFRQQNIPVRYVWLRFPRLFSVPFLIYARWRGYSHREWVNGHQHGYWNFSHSWLMSTLFPWILWLDTVLLTLIKVYLPLRLGYTLVCDRFVVDILADLMTGLDDLRFDERIPGRLFLDLLPQWTKVVILDLDTETVRQRSPELKGDRSHAQRRKVYLELARRHCLPILSTAPSIEAIRVRLIDEIAGRASPERSAEEPIPCEPTPDQRAH